MNNKIINMWKEMQEEEKKFVMSNRREVWEISKSPPRLRSLDVLNQGLEQFSIQDFVSKKSEEDFTDYTNEMKKVNIKKNFRIVYADLETNNGENTLIQYLVPYKVAEKFYKLVDPKRTSLIKHSRTGIVHVLKVKHLKNTKQVYRWVNDQYIKNKLIDAFSHSGLYDVMCEENFSGFMDVD